MGRIMYDINNNECRVLSVESKTIVVERKNVVQVKCDNKWQTSYEKLIYYINDIGSKLFFNKDDGKLKFDEISNHPDYAEYMPLIQENLYKRFQDILERIKRYEPDNPMTPLQKQDIIDSYHNNNHSRKEEYEFRKSNKNGSYFARLDLDTCFYDIDNYFKGNYYTKVYLSENPIGKRVFLDEDSVVWQIEAGLYIEQEGVRINSKPLSMQITRNSYIDSGIVIDWRSPVANLFYDDKKTSMTFNGRYNYQHDLMLKRRFKGSEFANLYITSDSLYDKGTVDPFLMDILIKNRHIHKLTDIIKTIQSNQNSIIRQPLNSNLIVQGCAGSGKTMIMLHRLSYLKFNNPMDPESIKILTPHELFNVHIYELAKKLELEEIGRFSVENYYKAILARFNDQWVTPKTISPETSFNQKYVNYIYSDEFKSQFRNEYLNWSRQLSELLKSINLIKDKYGLAIRAIEQANDHNKIENYKRFLPLLKQRIDRIIDIDVQRKKKKEERDLCVQQFIVLLNKKKTALETMLDDLIKQINGFYNEYDDGDNLNANEEMQSIQGVHDSIVSEVEKIQRYIDILNQGNIDRKLLREIASKFSDLEIKKELITIDRVQADLEKIQKKIRQAQGKTFSAYESLNEEDQRALQEDENNINSSGLEDQIALLRLEQNLNTIEVENVLKDIYEKVTIKKRLEYGVQNNRDKVFRFDLYVQTLFCLWYYGKPKKKDQFLFIDEGQDLALNEYRLLRDVNSNNVKLNVFGDTNQLITVGRGTPDWTAMANEFYMSIFTINENYRNTIEITEYCNKELGFQLSSVGLSGEKVRHINTTLLQKELKRHVATNERIAIIAKDLFEDSFNNFISKISNQFELYYSDIKSGGITVLNIEGAKGLEFDTVCVFPKGMSKNEKYIAYSRALSTLIIVE